MEELDYQEIILVPKYMNLMWVSYKQLICLTHPETNDFWQSQTLQWMFLHPPSHFLILLPDLHKNKQKTNKLFTKNIALIFVSDILIFLLFQDGQQPWKSQFCHATGQWNEQFSLIWMGHA